MKRNDSNPKHLASGKYPVCGYKAKAAIFAGMIALTLVPVTAYASTMPMDGQSQPQQMVQTFEAQQDRAPENMPADMAQHGGTEAPCGISEDILRRSMDFIAHKGDSARIGEELGFPGKRPAPRGERAKDGAAAPGESAGQGNPFGPAAAPLNGEQPPAIPMGENAGQPSQDVQPGQPAQDAQPGQSDTGAQPGQPDTGAPSGQSDTGAPSGQSSQDTQPGQPTQDVQPGQPDTGDQSSSSSSSDADTTVSDDVSGQSYTSTTGGENALLVSGKSVTLSGITVNKTGDSSSENADFYGTNAAILATNGATLTIDGATIVTDGAHANAVFSYGTGTTVNISDSTITTSGNNSGGLMTTGGATLNATNLTVTTSGNSSAAIRSDRGGGTVTVSEGSYETSGVGSPAIYSTADITVSDATISASNSEAVVIEGGNSVTLVNVDATGNNAKLNGQSTIATNVLIYQSMSGDASEGSSSFTMNGGSLTSLTGAMFHVTNVTTTINLTNVDLVNASDSSDFLIASADSWGTSGKNGGHATVNLTSQTVSGNITVDSVSSVTLNLQNSFYTGAIANSGTVNVTMDASSTWTLTGDSYITSLSGDTSGINLNGYTLYVNGVAYSG